MSIAPCGHEKLPGYDACVNECEVLTTPEALKGVYPPSPLDQEQITPRQMNTLQTVTKSELDETIAEFKDYMDEDKRIRREEMTQFQADMEKRMIQFNANLRIKTDELRRAIRSERIERIKQWVRESGYKFLAGIPIGALLEIWRYTSQ